MGWKPRVRASPDPVRLCSQFVVHLVTKNKHEHTRWGSQHLHHRAMSANLNRMSIDWFIDRQLDLPLHEHSHELVPVWYHLYMCAHNHTNSSSPATRIPSRTIDTRILVCLSTYHIHIVFSRLTVVAGLTTSRRTHSLSLFALRSLFLWIFLPTSPCGHRWALMSNREVIKCIVRLFNLC